MYLFILLALSLPLQQAAKEATFFPTPLEKVAKNAASHVKTCGYVKTIRGPQDDGDYHIILTRNKNSKKTLVTEITPYIKLPIPEKDTYIEVSGFPRIDPNHHWPEINPVVSWNKVDKCSY